MPHVHLTALQSFFDLGLSEMEYIFTNSCTELLIPAVFPCEYRKLICNY